MASSATRIAFGSAAYSAAMDTAWREVKSHLSNGIPLAWTIQRARAMYRKAWRDEIKRARGLPC